MRGDPVVEQIERLRWELDLRRRQLAAVRELSAAVYTTTSLDDVIVRILNVCLSVVKAQAGSVLLHDPEKSELVFQHVVGPKAAELMGVRFPADRGIAGRVFHEGESCISDDVTQDKNHYRPIGEKIEYITKNMITVPLKQADGEIIGVMQVLNKEDGLFGQEDLEILTILAHEAAMGIEHARLNRDARLAEVVKLIGDISHDVKNFLTPVDSGVRTLQMLFNDAFSEFESLVSGEEQSNGRVAELVAAARQSFGVFKEFFPEVVDMVLEGADSVTARAREIADCIKGEVAEPVFEEADVNEVVRSVVRVLNLVAERHDIAVDCDGLSEVPPIPMDKKLVHSAVYNLVNNAIPETPAGGQISVRTSWAANPEERGGGHAVIEVQDTGRGMPEEVRKRLFTKDAISTKPGGTGLGTRIVKNAVDAHNGTITVQSELGKGTCFTVTLPAAR